MEQWKSVKLPSREFAKRVDPGHESEYLPAISAAEKAIIAPVHTADTVQRNYLA
jgi:hypothetical protein